MVCRNPWLSKSMSNAKGLVLSRVVYAGDTRMINKKIWDFQTPSHVSPISSARILENLVESREPSAGKSYSRRQPDRSFYSFVQRPPLPRRRCPNEAGSCRKRRQQRWGIPHSFYIRSEYRKSRRCRTARSRQTSPQDQEVQEI